MNLWGTSLNSTNNLVGNRAHASFQWVNCWKNKLQLYSLHRVNFIDVQFFVFDLIIYMKKLLDSDWLRTMQFFLNTVQKRGN